MENQPFGPRDNGIWFPPQAARRRRWDPAAWVQRNQVVAAVAAGVVVAAVAVDGLVLVAGHPPATVDVRAAAPVAAFSPTPTPVTAGPPQASATTETVVLMGDSHAWLWSARVPTFPDIGVVGAVTDDLQPQVTAALAMHPRYVLISGGTNDLNLGHGWQRPAGNISAMVDRIKAAGATPILLLVPQYDPEFKPGTWSAFGLLPSLPPDVPMHGMDQVPLLNRALEALGVPVIRPPAGETMDGAHLNAAGYADLTRQLLAIVG